MNEAILGYAILATLSAVAVFGLGFAVGLEVGSRQAARNFKAGIQQAAERRNRFAGRKHNPYPGAPASRQSRITFRSRRK